MKNNKAVNYTLENMLMEQYKGDFRERTGRSIKMMICTRWQSAANFTDKAEFWPIVKLVFDITNWKWKETYIASPYETSKGTIKLGIRNKEKVFRRGVIDYICVNNGVTLTACANNGMGRDHTTVINSLRILEDRLDTDVYYQKFFREIAQYVKEEYHRVTVSPAVCRAEVLGVTE